MNSKKIALYGIIAALYVVVTLVLGAFSFGMIQFRISEVLMLLCLCKKEYIIPLSIGCFLSNVIGFALGMSVLPLDFVLGTLGTVVSCILMYQFRNVLTFKRPLLSLLMPALANGIFVGLELAIYESSGSNFFNLFLINGAYVALGEIVSCFMLGLILYVPFMKAVKRIEERFQSLMVHYVL